VLAIQMATRDRCHKKLTAVCVFAGIGHGQQKRSVVLQCKCRCFIVKLATIDAHTSSAVSLGDVATLDHETRDYSMKCAILVCEDRAVASFQARAKASEVQCSFGGFFIKQLENDALGCEEKHLSQIPL